MLFFNLKTSYRIVSIVPVAMETQLSNHEYYPIARLKKMGNILYIQVHRLFKTLFTVTVYVLFLKLLLFDILRKT